MSGPPPGSTGLPLVGESLAFLRDGFGFIRERTRRHGPVFRSHVLGRPTAFISGPEACEAWLDPAKIERAGAMPGPVLQLFGGKSLPLLDGQVHRRRKELVMAAFSHAALAGYLPDVECLSGRMLAGWAAKGEVKALPDLKRLSLACIAANMLGIAPPDEGAPPSPRLEELSELYGRVLGGFTALPVPIPGSTFQRGLRARDRILEGYDAEIRARSGRTPDPDAPKHGIDLLVGARAADGSAIAPGDASLELHHVFLAGVIVFAELATLLVELASHPDVRERVTAEVLAAAPAGPLSPEAFARMPYLNQVVMEAKRRCDAVPVAFGKAAGDFELLGHRIPKGWSVYLCIGENNRFAASFRDPDRFDPDRFSPERAEHLAHPHAYVPQGPGPVLSHQCAGLDYATLVMATFTTLLVRGYTWELPAQDRSLDPTKLPPEPRSGLLLRVRER